MNKKIFIIGLLVVVAAGCLWFLLAPKVQEYSSDRFSFRVNVPEGFTPDTDYINLDLGPGREITGVGFHIPVALAQGTNLSADSHVAVEQLSQVVCEPSDFLDSPSATETAVIGPNSFAVAHQMGAAAGNLYDETIHITKKDSRCYAVRYFIHSTNIANYPAGAVKEFDRAGLLSAFDQFTRSLVIY